MFCLLAFAWLFCILRNYGNIPCYLSFSVELECEAMLSEQYAITSCTNILVGLQRLHVMIYVCG